MSGTEFVDRESGLETLHEAFGSERAELIVIYGRRRLGKSALVREATKDIDEAVYWQATEETPDVQLADFVETVSESHASVDDVRRDWEALLRFLGQRDAVVVLDEFPYLVQSDEAVPSKIQRVWDTDLEETAMTLVLVGSSISVMEEKVLGGGSPLYGRRTATIDLPPLSISHAKRFFPVDDADEVMRWWGVFGGTPYYLQALDSTATFRANVQQTILSEHGLLHNEPEFLLRTEFGIHEPQTYYTILRAIASGHRESNEIANFAGIDTNSLSSYLSKLRRLRLVGRDVPVTANPNATRKSRYRLNEPLFRFWFRYVYGQEGRLVQLGEDAYGELVEPTFSSYMGPVFEQICQDALPSLVPRTYLGVGYWWHDEYELDVLGLGSDGALVAGECKYTSRQMNAGDLADLERAAGAVDWIPDDGSDPERHYCCFARSGFSEGLESAAASRDDLSLFTPEDILG